MRFLINHLLRAKSSPIWRRLIAGRLTSQKLPEELDLSDILGDMDRLWRSTARDSRSRERGACIVLVRNTLKLVHEVVGITSQSVQPMCRVSDYGDHLGFFHTHPLYPDGTEQVGFSEKDFAGVLEDGEKLSVVRSGNLMFALVRTKQTRPPALVSQQEEDDFLAVFYGCYYVHPGLTQSQAQRRANHALCRWLGLAFYAGEFGQPLRRELTP